MKLVHAGLSVRKDSESSFHYCVSPVKLLHACLCVRRDLESLFYCSRGSVKLVLTSFYHCEGLVKIIHASLSVRRDSDSSFDHGGSPVKLLYTCLGVRRDLEAVFTMVEVLGKNCLHELHGILTVVKTSFKVPPDTQTGVQELHRTSTVVKMLQSPS